MMRKFLSLSIPKKRSLIDAKGKKSIQPKQKTPMYSSGMESRIWMADKLWNTWGSSIVNNVEGG